MPLLHFYLAMLYLVSHVQLFVAPWTAAHQAPLSLGILQARILEWVVISSSRGSFQPRDWTCISCVSCIAKGFFTHWATRKAYLYKNYSALFQSADFQNVFVQSMWKSENVLHIQLVQVLFFFKDHFSALTFSQCLRSQAYQWKSHCYRKTEMVVNHWVKTLGSGIMSQYYQYHFVVLKQV